MTTLEKKVDAIARHLLANSPAEQRRTLEELRELLAGKRTTGSVREEISAALADLGIPEHLVGHRHLVEAVRLVVENEELVYGITTRLYPEVAKICGSTKSKVERAMRHGIELCFDRCDPETIREYFGNTISPNKGKLTNSEFIARLASVIRERTGG